MQIIYSAGTTSPTSPRTSPLPSPRHAKLSSPRYYEGWRPVMPGYKAPPHHSVIVQRTIDGQHLSDSTDSSLKDSIPGMPRALAITCLVCNILLPGLGTFVSGMSVLCCSHVRPGGRDKANVVWVNTWVAVLQFLTAFLFLLGWIWSIMWGVSFLSISDDSKAGDVPKEPGEGRDLDGCPGTTQVSHSAHEDGTNHSRTTTATLSGPGGGGPGSRSGTEAPIIVLQEPPVIVQSQVGAGGDGQGEGTAAGGNSQRPTLNPYNPRHQRILRRQNTDDEIFLTPDALEQIVFHNAPVPDGMQSTSVCGPPSKA